MGDLCASQRQISSQVSFRSNLVYIEKNALSFPLFMLRGQRQKCQLKAPQAEGTAGLCVALTFKSWVASPFTLGVAEGEGGQWGVREPGGAFQRALAKAPDHVTPLAVGSQAHPRHLPKRPN